MKKQKDNFPVTTCKGIFGFMFGHDFKPIFSERIEYQIDNSGEHERTMQTNITHNPFQTPMSKFDQGYVKTVCTRCGKEL